MIIVVRRRTLAVSFAASALAVALALPPAHARAQAASSAPGPVAGQNVNMVSGTEWPGGDPFLQRDNEPSIAVSSQAVERLLAGGNTYRTVDLPFPDGGTSETGDAWLGIYKSFDAGRTWKTYLLPGYPQDTSPEGAASPLKQLGLQAAADATVRAGTNGLFAMSGIAFNRGTNTGVVFVSRFIDLNVKENGDASTGHDSMPYVDTALVDTGNSGQFLDKPWIAVDIPRPFASGTCSISTSVRTKTASGDTVTPVTRTFPIGPMYVAWSRFTGSQSTKIMVSRSLDCGRTWDQNPTKVSEGNSINQGTALAIDPQTGAVYVAWRRFATNSQTDAILVARSTDGGRTFANKDTREIASFLPFDQGTTGYSFRTSALPSLAVSVADGVSRLHVAWAQRDAAGGDARIVVSTSSDGGATWSAPVKVDDGPAKDEFGQAFATNDGESLTRGHQVMPQITFSAGRLMVLYYDLRLDHTVGVFAPNEVDGAFDADAETGRLYTETRQKKGELSADESPGGVAEPDAVYKPYITDAPPTTTDPGLTIRRHTVDLRVAQADPAVLALAGPATTPPPFDSVPVSRYPFGTRGDKAYFQGDSLDQLQVNPPNLPLFQQGTVPFFGDYIDIAGETFYAEPAPVSQPWCAGVWCYRVSDQTEGGAKVSPVFYATWTSNQDVRPPKDGDWQHYTPVGGGGASVYDPTKGTPVCVPGQEGMRNQNIYASRITQGLLVSSPQPSKPLSLDAERAFVVVAENATPLERAFRLRIADQPAGAGARASFLASTSTADGPRLCRDWVPSQPPDSTSCTAIDVRIPPGSSIARSVFVKADPSAQLTVNVDEVDATGKLLGPAGLSGYVLLNAVPVLALAAPDGSTSSDQGETYQPSISLINVSNPNVSNVNVSNINVSNVNVSNVNVSNVNVSNVNVSNPDIADINVSNVNVSNVNVSNVNVSNVNVSNVNVSNQPISDANYVMTNEGNTTHSFHVKLVGEAPPSGTALQVIVSKPYYTPVANGCSPAVENRPAVLASVPPEIVPISSLTDPNIPGESTANATVALAPGEKVVITVRGNVDVPTLAEIASHLTPAVVAHGATGAYGFTAVLAIPSSGSNLPVPEVGVHYEAKIETLGGTGPFTFSYKGTLPSGLSLTPDGTLAGTITGTPTQPEDATFTVTVTDKDGATATKTITLSVQKGPTDVAVGATPPAGAVQGQPVTFTATVSPKDAGDGVPTPGGNVRFDLDGGAVATVALASGQASWTAASGLPAGSHVVTVVYLGDTNYAESAPFPVTYIVGPASTTTTLVDSPDPSQSGASVTFTATVAPVAPATGVPGGTVSVANGAASCTIVLAGGTGSCSLAPALAGVQTWTATYSGDGGFLGSVGTAQHTVQGNTTTSITSDSPDPSIVGEAVTVGVTVASTAGTPTGSVAVSGGGGSCSVTLTNGTGSCSLKPTTLGVDQTWTATYAGTAVFTGSAATALHTVNNAPYAFTGFLNPLTTALPYPKASISGSWTFSRVLPIKWQLKDSAGKAVTSASAVRSIVALYSGATCTAGDAPPLTSPDVAVLYTPAQGAAGGSDFRPGNTYNFNWDATKNARPGCWSVVLELDDANRWTTKVQLQ